MRRSTHVSNVWHRILVSSSSKMGSHQLVNGPGKSIKKCKKYFWVLLQVALNHASFGLYRPSLILYSIHPFDHTPRVPFGPSNLYSTSFTQTKMCLSSLGVSKRCTLTSQRSTRCNTTSSWSNISDRRTDSIQRVLSDCISIMLRKLTMQATGKILSRKWWFGCEGKNQLIVLTCILTGKRENMMHWLEEWKERLGKSVKWSSQTMMVL